MNKTIKQAERYEAPVARLFIIEMASRIMNISGENPDLIIEDTDFN